MHTRKALAAELRAIDFWETLPSTDSAADFDAREARRLRRLEIDEQLRSAPESADVKVGYRSAQNALLCKLSHDIQNKLSVIVGQCELLAGRLSDPDSIGRVDSIRNHALSISEIVKQSDCPGGSH
jgi:signal transduction histidine kinase